MLDYMVTYVSKTGNTKRIAKEIFRVLPGTSKDICNLGEEGSAREAKTYFVGFWVNRGTCEMKVIDYLATLSGKRVVLFGTCGMGSDEAYYQTIQNNVEVWLPENCEYLGTFLCQGKMPIQVRNRYEERKKTMQDQRQIDKMIQNFDEALLHPNEKDIQNAEKFVKDCLSQLDKI